MGIQNPTLVRLSRLQKAEICSRVTRGWGPHSRSGLPSCCLWAWGLPKCTVASGLCSGSAQLTKPGAQGLSFKAWGPQKVLRTGALGGVWGPKELGGVRGANGVGGAEGAGGAVARASKVPPGVGGSGARSISRGTAEPYQSSERSRGVPLGSIHSSPPGRQTRVGAWWLGSACWERRNRRSANTAVLRRKSAAREASASMMGMQGPHGSGGHEPISGTGRPPVCPKGCSGVEGIWRDKGGESKASRLGGHGLEGARGSECPDPSEDRGRGPRGSVSGLESRPRQTEEPRGPKRARERQKPGEPGPLCGREPNTPAQAPHPARFQKPWFPLRPRGASDKTLRALAPAHPCALGLAGASEEVVGKEIRVPRPPPAPVLGEHPPAVGWPRGRSCGLTTLPVKQVLFSPGSASLAVVLGVRRPHRTCGCPHRLRLPGLPLPAGPHTYRGLAPAQPQGSWLSVRSSPPCAGGCRAAAPHEGGREGTTCCRATVPQLLQAQWGFLGDLGGCGQCGGEALPAERRGPNRAVVGCTELRLTP